MPGPSNGKKKRRSHAKSHKSTKSRPRVSTESSTNTNDISPPTSPSPQQVITPPPLSIAADLAACGSSFTAEDAEEHTSQDRIATRPSRDHMPYDEQFVLKQPYIHDPGNGPRVRDTRAFLTSSYFAQPPALDDPLCAEFAQEEVLQMLMTVLPEDLAMILWYNKSRATGRICPSCQRLYRLGDVLPPLIGEDHEPKHRKSPPQLSREQKISGLCSPVCFVVASLNHPGAIKSAWGRMIEDMDDLSWELLNTNLTHSTTSIQTKNDLGVHLSMLVRMTRLHDLGLGQLCLPDLDLDDELDKAGRRLANVSLS